MKYLLIVCINLISFAHISAQFKIEEVSIKNRLHYKVSNSNATYFIDKYSGGISSILDKKGSDWVGWKRLEKEKYPESAAGDYRGIPNLVFGGDDGGVGHPGFDKVICFKTDDNRIRARSINGKWEWQYIFFSKYIEIQILKTPSAERNYWFLYEGTPGGEFNPVKQYWGTNEGLKPTKPNYNKGEEEHGKWNWVFFGHNNSNRILFLLQKKPDNLNDTFGFMGNLEKGIEANDGMVVFGFGRDKKATPLINKNNIFYIGFYEKKIDKETFYRLEKYIQKNFY